MPSKERDRERDPRDSLDLEERSTAYDKRRGSRSERGKTEKDGGRGERSERDRDRDRERDRDRDRDRERHHRSSRASRPKDDGPGDVYATASAHRRRVAKTRGDGHSPASPSPRTPVGERERERERGPAADNDNDDDDDNRAGDDSSDDDDDDDRPEPPAPIAGERMRVPYPSFSKAHSKENIHSREDLSIPGGGRSARGSARGSSARGSGAHRSGDPLTPEPTDVGSEDKEADGRRRRTRRAGGRDDEEEGKGKEKQQQRGSRSREPPAGRGGGSSSLSSSKPKDKAAADADDRPPSPPDTDVTSAGRQQQQQRRARETPESARRAQEAGGDEPRSRAGSLLGRAASRADDKSKLSAKSKASSSQATATYADGGGDGRSPTTRGGPTTMMDAQAARRSSASVHLVVDEQRSSTRSTHSSRRGGTAGVNNNNNDPSAVDGSSLVESSPESAQDSSPKTPTPLAGYPMPIEGRHAYGHAGPQPPQPPHPFFKPAAFPPAFMYPAADPVPLSQTPMTDLTDLTSSVATSAAYGTPQGGPPPPPPPPPPLNIQEAPRVDYLLQNGGLSHPVPKTFLSVLPRHQAGVVSARYSSGMPVPSAPLYGAQTLFSPFFGLLDQYHAVLGRHGSVAVATGHRTVARRLLDRLENVFSRDLPAEGCACVVCEHRTRARYGAAVEAGDEDGGRADGVDAERRMESYSENRGLGWGEVLERVQGRAAELPAWPPFDLASLGIRKAEAGEGSRDNPDLMTAVVGRDNNGGRSGSPIQLDPDIADEFREHYLRQSIKVRAAVDRWLSVCAEAPAPPPQDVDDETLTFAILTSLDPDEKPFFNALLSGSRELLPALRAPTPVRKPRNDFIVRSGLALQRLYRLPTAPRDAEAAIFLIRAPTDLHDLLATIADIHPSEWEILTSGRFDGFLWSGSSAATDAGSLDPDVTPTRTAEDGLSSRGGGGHSFFPPSSTGPSSRSPAPSPAPLHPGLRALGKMAIPGGGGGFGASRATTPLSRGATPASFISMSSAASSVPVTNPASSNTGGTGSTAKGPAGHSSRRHAAVSTDEETEMAVLAEVEREIFLGMEALEDAFETLHQRAEAVRTALRTRGAALSLSLQQRRGGGGGGAGGAAVVVDVLPQSGNSVADGYERPAWAAAEDGTGGENAAAAAAATATTATEPSESEDDWARDDFDIAPEDSASNISTSKKRRPKRRDERRTPAPIAEDDEEN